MPGISIENPDLSLADVMSNWPETIPVFIRHRMLCVGCLVSPFHTIMDACRAYTLDLDQFLQELQDELDLTKFSSVQEQQAREDRTL